MTEKVAQNHVAKKAVAGWIILGIVMLFIQIVLGGITRLTGSGLSITEWNVVTGTLPPLNERSWLSEFEKYKQTPQFQLLNADFTLDDFKFIYFWEWLHRFWARLIAIVFVLGFSWLQWRGFLKREMIRPLMILFLLGALQGIVGWIMVKSGLTGDAVYVKPTRLAVHFVLALVLISYAVWFALQLMVSDNKRIHSAAVRSWSLAILTVMVFQLAFGALMAGHRAATAAPTWPDINGQWIPPSILRFQVGDLLRDKVVIQFFHRTLAYIILIMTIGYTVSLARHGSRSTILKKMWWIPLVLVMTQVFLGISSLFTSIQIVPNQWGMFEWLAQLHQITGMLFLLSLMVIMYLVSNKSFK